MTDTDTTNESPDTNENGDTTGKAPQLGDGLLATFICPVTRSKVTQDGNHLVSEVGGLRYPWEQGIWRLIADHAILPEGIESLDAFKAKYADQIPV